jgi:hypothetical protein
MIVLLWAPKGEFPAPSRTAKSMPLSGLRTAMDCARAPLLAKAQQ